MDSSYRTLLPKPGAVGGSADQTNNPAGHLNTVPTAKPGQTVNACNNCRRRKAKCDGGYPKCSRCLKYSQDCTYPIRMRATAETTEDASTIQLLRTSPIGDALNILNSLRSDTAATNPNLDPDLISGPQSALSESDLLKTLLLHTNNHLEFELMVRHPISYPHLIPLSLASPKLEALLRPWNTAAPRPMPDSDLSSATSPTEPNTRPLSARPLVDERLRQLDMANWSSVPITNELAASVLSHYIEVDYQTLPLFDIDLFLDDLVHNRPSFCSSLLVNSLFSWTCQTYTAISFEACTLSLVFFDQARQLLADAGELDTLTTVAALQCLCIAALGYGRDHIGLGFLRQSVRIGTRMGLFGANSELESANTWLVGMEDWNRSASFTAWGVFNWVTLIGLRYHNVETIIPPRIHRPEIIAKEDAESLGSETIASLTTNIQVFRACCELWVICSDVIREYHGDDNTDSTWDHREFAEQIFRKLLDWADSLPLSLVRSDQSTHAVLMMHVYYHAIVADVFRYSLNSPDAVQLQSFETLRATPQAVYAASLNQLKRLFLILRLSFKRASLSILSQTVLIYVCNAVVREVQKKDQLEAQFYFKLCLAASQDLSGCYPEAFSVTRGLLVMALERGAVKIGEARSIAQNIVDLDRHHVAATSDEAGASLIDLDLAITDPSAARTKSLITKFDSLMLQESGTETGDGK